MAGRFRDLGITTIIVEQHAVAALKPADKDLRSEYLAICKHELTITVW